MQKDNTSVYCAFCKIRASAKAVPNYFGYRCNNCKIIWSLEDLKLSKEERVKLIPQKLKELKKREKDNERRRKLQDQS
jgi:hypothetical protein